MIHALALRMSGFLERISPRAWARALWRHLVRSHTSPGRLAVAVGVGILIGHLPIIPFHFFATVLVCWALRLNTATTYLAANVSNPFLLPFLVFGSVQTGHLLLEGTFLALSVEQIAEQGPRRFFAALVLGSIVQGAALGALLGALTYVILRRRRRALAPDPIELAIDEVAKRYAAGRRATYHYVRSKLRTDPVARAVAERAPAGGRVLDIGCGRGQTAILLAVLDPSRTLRGLDWDAAKIGDATEAAAGLSATFEQGDFREADLPASSADTILLLDVLHYLPRDTQDAVLERACRAIRPGGVLLLREMDDARGWRSWATRTEERVFTALRFNRGERLVFRPAAELVAICEREGLVVTVEPMWGSTPFANVLIEARRPSAP